jgi:hypothetical protein
MYASAQARGLDFFRTPDEVYKAAASGALEAISVSDDLMLEKTTFPFVLPNTRRFADSLAKEFRGACGERLVVTSGVRPLDDQPRNASPKSVHPTGMAVDFRKPRGPCLKWLRKGLLALEKNHVVEATEERHPVHFHVAVLQQAPERVISSSAGSTRGTASEPKASPGVDAALSKSRTTATSPSTESVYRVRAGDNLTTIAQRYNTTPDRLQEINGLRSSVIMPGQLIKLR